MLAVVLARTLARSFAMRLVRSSTYCAKRKKFPRISRSSHFQDAGGAASTLNHHRAAFGYRQRLDSRHGPSRDTSSEQVSTYISTALQPQSGEKPSHSATWVGACQHAPHPARKLQNHERTIYGVPFLSGSTKSGGLSNALSLDRQRDLYGNTILRQHMRWSVRQEMPRTFDMVYAKSRSYREKPGTDRWRAEDESRVYQLSYDIPAEDLPLFWQLVVAKANQLRVQTRRGEPAAYFKNPQLLMQAHDLKNMFAAPSLDEVLAKFERTALAYIDFDKVDMRSCWIDVGARDFVANLGSREPAYTAAMQLDLGDVGPDGLPAELPCWMITRKHSPPMTDGPSLCFHAFWTSRQNGVVGGSYSCIVGSRTNGASLALLPRGSSTTG